MKRLEIDQTDFSPFTFFNDVAAYTPKQFGECFEMQVMEMDAGETLSIGEDRLAVISREGELFSVIDADSYTADTACTALLFNREIIDNIPCYGMGCAMLHLNAAKWITAMKRA